MKKNQRKIHYTDNNIIQYEEYLNRIKNIETEEQFIERKKHINMSKLKVKDFKVIKTNKLTCMNCHFIGDDNCCNANKITKKLDKKYGDCKKGHIYVKKLDYKAMFKACVVINGYEDQIKALEKENIRLLNECHQFLTQNELLKQEVRDYKAKTNHYLNENIGLKQETGNKDVFLKVQLQQIKDLKFQLNLKDSIIKQMDSKKAVKDFEELNETEPQNLIERDKLTGDFVIKYYHILKPFVPFDPKYL